MQAARSQLWSRLTGSPLQAAEVQARLEVSAVSAQAAMRSYLRLLSCLTGSPLQGAGVHAQYWR